LSLATKNSTLLKLLLAHGWKANLAERDGETALMEAAQFVELAAVKLLLAAGADVNAVNNNGDTALLIALHYPSLKEGELLALVKILIAAGADVNVQARDGTTPLKLAEKRDKSDLVVFLRKAGAREGGR
jgi:uncharacterized protein